MFDSEFSFKEQSNSFWKSILLGASIDKMAELIKKLDALEPGDIVKLDNGEFGVVFDNRWRAGYMTFMISHKTPFGDKNKKKAFTYAEVRISGIAFANEEGVPKIPEYEKEFEEVADYLIKNLDIKTSITRI